MKAFSHVNVIRAVRHIHAGSISILSCLEIRSVVNLWYKLNIIIHSSRVFCLAAGDELKMG